MVISIQIFLFLIFISCGFEFMQISKAQNAIGQIYCVLNELIAVIACSTLGVIFTLKDLSKQKDKPVLKTKNEAVGLKSLEQNSENTREEQGAIFDNNKQKLIVLAVFITVIIFITVKVCTTKF